MEREFYLTCLRIDEYKNKCWWKKGLEAKIQAFFRVIIHLLE
jgi:hypothetical protein